MTEPNPSLSDLLNQALTRDGQVIGPGAFRTDLEQSVGRHQGDGEWMSDETLIGPYDRMKTEGATRR